MSLFCRADWRLGLLLAGTIAGVAGQSTLAEQLDRTPLAVEQRAEVRKLIRVREYRTVETILVAAIDADPKSPDLLILAARVFLLDKNPANAAIAFKKAERIRPLGTPDRFSLAMAYLAMGRGAWAQPELERLEREDPGNTQYTYWLARIAYDERKYDAAVRRLQAVTKANPGFMRAWDNLGLALEGTGGLEEAVASYQQANRLNREQKPPSPWPPLNLGTLLTRMGQLKEGEQLLREAAGYDATLAQAHHRLGMNLHKQQRDQDALPELQRAAELDPSDPEPLYTLGQLYRDQGNERAAAQMFEKFRAAKKNKGRM